MTALDEAITVVDERWPHFDAEVILPVMFDMLGPNLLARLAIEQGAFIRTVTSLEKAGITLYRVVEP